MARFNVFGKPIVFDVGAKIVNGNRIPPQQEVKEGDDISDDTKSLIDTFRTEETRDNETKVGEIFSNDPTNLPSYSNSQLAVNTQNGELKGDVAGLVKKKKTDTGVSGNDLLPGVVGGLPGVEDTDTNVVPRYTSAILTQNRFTAKNKRNGTEAFRVNPDHPDETKGSYQKFRHSANGKEFDDGILAHVGTLLTLRATRELGARDAYGRDGPDGAGASLATILPGGSQAGLLKVDVSDLSATDVLNSLLGAGTESANLDASKALSKHKVLDINSESFGQMNNVLEPFSGLLPIGMLGLSTALVLILKIAIKVVLAIFLLITSASKSASKRTDTIGRHWYGDYNRSAAFEPGGFPPIPLPASLFGLRETVHPFGDSVNAGIEAFFGGGLVDFTRILEAPGFYAVFSRSIVLSAAGIVHAIGDVMKGNPIQVAQNIIALVEVIKQSKVVSAMNMFASIGDSALTLAESPDVSDRGTISTIDSLPDGLGSGFKSRLNGKLKLAWGVGQSPSTYLLPAGFQSALSVYSQLTDGKRASQGFSAMIRNDISLSTALGENGRLDHKTVEDIESKLDAEYMPFYFHDLRTNEVTSFPAFLTSISDDFSVNWENTEGYGRVDPVKIYKSTHRKIAISFIMASTSPEDFDQMWVKINKLVTLVYPQWSEGTTLKNNETMFTQPFSQTLAASPIIRLRLGDLFRSNYSKFALARLFGLGQNDKFKLKGVGKLESLTPTALNELDKFFKFYFDDDKPLFVDMIYDALPGHYEEAEKSAGLLGGLAAAIGVPSKPKQRRDPPIPTPCRVTKDLGENQYQISFVSPIDGTPLSDSPSFVAKRLQLAYNEKTVAGLMKAQNINLINITPDDISKMNDFFNDNAIVRSFESVSGKGLAAGIDSMNFAWLDNTPWETDTYGSRAPKLCKITMALTPIHDIAPGLDSQGFNRAPVYNVGRPMNMLGGDSWDTSEKGKEKFLSRVGKLGTRK